MDHNIAADRGFLSTAPALPKDRRLAAVVMAVIAAAFAAAVPFAQVQWPRTDAFIPGYEATLILCDVITAALLYGQFAILRRSALLVLASGYLFTAAMAAVHMLTFPGLFAPTGLLAAGPQTTAWLYMLWHGGFPLAAIAYAVMKDRAEDVPAAMSTGSIVAVAVAAVAAIVAVLTAMTTGGHDVLPAIMQGNRYTPSFVWVVSTVWALSGLALAVLWVRRPHSVLDVWLMVVLGAWIFDIGLSAALNAGRFDVGFYLGRAYGFLASMFVLIVILLQITALYARSARLFEREREGTERRLHELEAELIHMSRLSELGQMVSTLAHEVNQPLAAVNNYIATGDALIEAGQPEKARSALLKAVQQTARAGVIIQRLRNFVKKREAERRAENLGETVEEAVALALAGPEGRRVKLDMRVPSDMSVLIDRVQIQQVVLNLVRNAVEAMSAGPRSELVLAVQPADGDMVEISIADRGPGLAKEVREKLFEPFVTTKSAGLGVGLSICRSIVESHGGRMWVADNDGGGTVFRFTVPRAPAVTEVSIATGQAAE